jgi:hypothetical protein
MLQKLQLKPHRLLYNNACDSRFTVSGLDFILGNFAHQMRLRPRTISTKTTEGRQIITYSKEEAIARFKQANFSIKSGKTFTAATCK